MSVAFTKTNHAIIYVRMHESYVQYNVCNIGKTTNLAECDAMFADNEFRRGKFIAAYAVQSQRLDTIYSLLKIILADYNYNQYGSTEFFKMDALQHIETIFKSISLTYHKLTDNEIDELLNTQDIVPAEPTINELLEQLRAIQMMRGDPIAPATVTAELITNIVASTV